jgi:Domain of unknown function (DUF4189)
VDSPPRRFTALPWETAMFARLATLALLSTAVTPVASAWDHDRDAHHDRDRDGDHDRDRDQDRDPERGAWQAPQASFGAIAYSTTTGQWGWANGFTTLAEAQVAATGFCGASDCVAVNWEQASCAALAVANDDPAAWGAYGGAPSQDQADLLALDECQGRSGGRCSVVAWTCW